MERFVRYLITARSLRFALVLCACAVNQICNPIEIKDKP